MMSNDKSPFSLLGEEFKEFKEGLASLRIGADNDNELPKSTTASKAKVDSESKVDTINDDKAISKEIVDAVKPVDEIKDVKEDKIVVTNAAEKNEVSIQAETVKAAEVSPVVTPNVAVEEERKETPAPVQPVAIKAVIVEEVKKEEAKEVEVKKVEEEIKEARVQPAAAKARVQPAASVSKPTKVEYVIPVVKGDRLEPSIIKIEDQVIKVKDIPIAQAKPEVDEKSNV